MSFPYIYTMLVITFDTRKVVKYFPPLDLRTVDEKIEHLKRRGQWL